MKVKPFGEEYAILRKEHVDELNRLARNRKKWMKKTPTICLSCMRVSYCSRVPYNERIAKEVWLRGVCPDIASVWERI